MPEQKENYLSRPLHGSSYFIKTFGCQMNENDSQRIAGLLQEAGAVFCPSPEESDIIIINTCAVREKSEEKLFSYLGRISSFKNVRRKIIGVAGCVAQLYKNQLLKKKTDINFIIGPDNYEKIVDIIEDNGSPKKTATRRSRKWRDIPHHIIAHDNPVSAYVTIMEGCDNFCSYCVVPFTRGREKYRPIHLILDEAKELGNRGYKEIILLGQNVNSYRGPEGKGDFCSLLDRISDIEGIEWIRFITSHPKNFTKNLARAMARQPKICRQLHLPVQSGSDSVLRGMNRGYSRKEYLEGIRHLRSLIPNISLSTDIIVGFPGESDEDFHATCSLLKEVGYANIFSFRYSPRPHSAAVRYGDSVPSEVKKQRLIELQELQKRIQLEQNKHKVGQTMKVLCLGHSKKNENVFAGRNESYQVVNFQADRDVTGRFVDVHITDYGPYSLRGHAKT